MRLLPILEPVADFSHGFERVASAPPLLAQADDHDVNASVGRRIIASVNLFHDLKAGVHPAGALALQ